MEIEWNKPVTPCHWLTAALFFLLAILPLLTFTTACSNQSKPPNIPELLVLLSFAQNHVIINNGNDFVWKKVSIQLNDTYTYTTDILPRGASSLPLAEFHNLQGNAFDPQKMTPHHIILDVQAGYDGKPGHFTW